MGRWEAAAVAAMAAVALAGCGDGGGSVVDPDDPVVGLVAPDSVVVDALRDRVQLQAEVVHRSGRTAEVEAAWSGCGGGCGRLSAAGEFESLAEGECRAVAAWGGFEATTVVKARRQGVVTITFDDGWKSARTVGLPVLSAAGLVGNVAVVPESQGWPAFLTLPQMRELHAAGWSFVSHTMGHDSLPALPDDSLQWHMREPVRWLEAAGLRAADVLIVPYHAWGEREKAAVQETFSAARGHAVDSFWPERIAEWRPADPYEITALDGSTLARSAEGRAQVVSYVERAVREGLILDLQFHDIRPEDEVGFRALIEALAPYRDRFRSWSELYPLPS